jgi:hypothetical protein
MNARTKRSPETAAPAFESLTTGYGDKGCLACGTSASCMPGRTSAAPDSPVMRSAT